MAVAMRQYNTGASSDGGGSWVSLKPLNATIGQALAPILPIGHRNAGIWLGFEVAVLGMARFCMEAPIIT